MRTISETSRTILNATHSNHRGSRRRRQKERPWENTWGDNRIVENFPKLGKEIITQVQENQRVPNRINPRQNTLRHILIKLTKIKHEEQILRAARGKQQITHKGIPIRITAYLSIETLQARREWQDILKVMKENNLQPRLLYPARISFKYEGEIKIFTDKQKLRAFNTNKPAIQQMSGIKLRFAYQRSKVINTSSLKIFLLDKATFNNKLYGKWTVN